jgi:hypothetical protein
MGASKSTLVQCPTDSYVTKFHGNSGNSINKLCATCSDGTTIGCRGGDGGDPFEISNLEGFNKIILGKNQVYTNSIRIPGGKTLGGTGGIISGDYYITGNKDEMPADMLYEIKCPENEVISLLNIMRSPDKTTGLIDNSLPGLISADNLCIPKKINNSTVSSNSGSSGSGTGTSNSGSSETSNSETGTSNSTTPPADNSYLIYIFIAIICVVLLYVMVGSSATNVKILSNKRAYPMSQFQPPNTYPQLMQQYNSQPQFQQMQPQFQQMQPMQQYNPQYQQFR